MLSAPVLGTLAVRGVAIGQAAADRARVRVADALRAELPGVGVSIDGEDVVLTGRITPDDPRLRWIASLLA